MHITFSLALCAILASFTIAEVSNDLESERVKRVSVDDVEFSTAGDERESRRRKPANSNRDRMFADRAANSFLSFPVVLPPYQTTGYAFDETKRSCMMYMEGITVLVIVKATVGKGQEAYALPLGFNPKTNKSDEYGDAGYEHCPQNLNYTSFPFTLEYKPSGTYDMMKDEKKMFSLSKPFTLELTFTRTYGFSLTGATISGLTLEPGDLIKSTVTINGNASNAAATNIHAYYGYNFACSQTPALIFPMNNSDYYFGVIFNNFQFQDVGIVKNKDDTAAKYPVFSHLTADCIPTFSQGSWMGIIVTLVLLGVLTFAFLMLNSVQTMDRFDDPKQKQIVINFKE